MNKMRQWSMLTAAAVVVVFIAGWFLAVSPQRHKAAQLRSQAASPMIGLLYKYPYTTLLFSGLPACKS